MHVIGYMDPVCRGSQYSSVRQPLCLLQRAVARTSQPMRGHLSHPSKSFHAIVCDAHVSGEGHAMQELEPAATELAAKRTKIRRTGVSSMFRIGDLSLVLEYFFT